MRGMIVIPSPSRTIARIVALLAVVLGGVGLIGVIPALFVVVASLGLIAPNATTLALANARMAGSAAALLGVLQLTLGAVAAPLIGVIGAASAVPMATAIAAFGSATLATLIIARR
jgi:MFS transporter, DHA1 family, multidrug resistance protein